MNNYFNNYNNSSNWNNPNTYDYNNTFVDLKFVYCPICKKQAYVKYTKTLHKMLRCDVCKVLIFANGPISEQYLNRLAQFREKYF